MDTLAKRLEKALAARERSPAWLIQVTNKSKQTIYNILDGTTKADKISWGTAAQICLALRIDQDWLRTGRGTMDGKPSNDSDWNDIAAYRQAAALGEGAVPDEYAETHALKFRADSLRRKRLRAEALGVVYGKGDSMEPRIQSGDAILFDRADKDPKDGALYVVTYDGDLFAKRLVFMGNRWWVDSLNKDDPKWRKPRPIDEVKQFEIHGRVRWIGSWED
jgi:phage repressor protein C with HTH and peptisase S24 domain